MWKDKRGQADFLDVRQIDEHPTAFIAGEARRVGLRYVCGTTVSTLAGYGYLRHGTRL